jgi:hypothetical protein
MMRKLLISAACAAVLAPAAVGATVSSQPDVRGMVLTLSDMPTTGFSVVKEGFTTNGQAARESEMPLATYKQWGRVNGYDVAFEHGALLGPVRIESSVSTYKTAAGARASLLYAFATVSKPRAADDPMIWKRVLTGVIGKESRMWYVRTDNDQDTDAIDMYVLTWRYGSLRATIMAAGIRGPDDEFGPDQVMGLARTQQARIAAEGGGS